MEILEIAVEPNEAIRKIIDSRGITVRHFSEMLDTAEQTVSKQLSGKRPLTDRALVKMAKALNIPFDMIKYGDDLDYYINGVPEDEERDASNHSGVNDSARVIGVHDPDVFQFVKIIRHKVWASFVDNFNDFSFDDIEDTYPVYLPDLSGPINNDKHMIFEVLGESMEERLHDRDKVLGELLDDGDFDYLNSGIYIVAYRNKLVTKRIIDNDLLINGTLTLHSDNPKHGKITIRREDVRFIWRLTDLISSKL